MTLANCLANAYFLISIILQALQRHACRHASFVLRLLPLQQHLRSMPLTAGEILICLLAQRGKGCTIQDMQAVTQDNLCPGSSNQAGSSSGSSSDLAGSSPDRETMADDDYGDYNGIDGYTGDDADGEFDDD